MHQNANNNTNSDENCKKNRIFVRVFKGVRFLCEKNNANSVRKFFSTHKI